MTALRPLSPFRSLATLAATALLGACGSIGTGDGKPVDTTPAQPEGGSAYTEKQGWHTRRYAVAAANPLATEAGLQMLRAGGSAVDAAIAVQMVLTLVEPQSSGIGGGAFLLHFDGAKVDAFDGRETAPAGATESLFLQADGKPMPFPTAVVGGRAVGVPGTVRMLELAHRKHGKLPWAQLFGPAIALAENGFAVSGRLHTLISADPHLAKDPVAAAYFFNTDGKAWPVGHVLKNLALAEVLRLIASQGSRALHEGAVAQAVVSKVQNHPHNPGTLTHSDLADYRPVQREALCHPYTAADSRRLRLCGFPPPSSGAIAIGQMLGILSQTPAHALPLGSDGIPTPQWLHYYTEAARLAFADRAQYVADPDFVPPPGGSWMTMLEPDYLGKRARLIGNTSMKFAQPGQPVAVRTSYAPMPDQPEFGTSHISIVDAQGKAVAMTTTIEDAFGSRQMVHGFLLNNELTDFSFTPRDATGKLIANRVQPGKRPRSSMSPTLVFDADTNELLMSAGSPGGALIIHYTAKTLWGVFNWGLNAQQSINLPNFGSSNGPTLLEEKRFPAATIEALKAMGHDVREINMTSGLQALQNTPQGYFGGADPRREGIVLGD